uniref:cytochrome f n=1 Tax=Lithothamnion corallioides TaxID=1277934 RepID=UPI0023F444E3|nr:cytochrome f [Lithothamnion corallioides]WEA77003.1 cytochrome f [Lithothamnion corallioides]
MNLHYQNNLIKKMIMLLFLIIGISQTNLLLQNKAQAFPVYAQQGYENPREATGRIVCANCHLAQKNISIEAPKSILPNTVFETTVKIPYNLQSKQILSNGTKGKLNVGAIVILPDGFQLAPSNLISDEIKAKTKNVYIQPYSTDKKNILVVGPMAGNANQEITFPILSPDPNKDKSIHFLKYPIYAGGNRGRGQVYPNGDKSNNNAITSSISGKITDIQELEKGGYQIDIQALDGNNISENIPPGLDLQVAKGDNVISNQLLTQDPNVGGFGQNETEIVLQSPVRIQGMIAFFIITAISQIFFVLKKKQWEKVQVSEMNF